MNEDDLNLLLDELRTIGAPPLEVAAAIEHLRRERDEARDCARLARTDWEKACAAHHERIKERDALAGENKRLKAALEKKDA